MDSMVGKAYTYGRTFITTKVSGAGSNLFSIVIINQIVTGVVCWLVVCVFFSVVMINQIATGVVCWWVVCVLIS